MSLFITWLGQGGYLFECGETRICVDPYLSDSVEKAEGMKRLVPVPVQPGDLLADLIVCTHDHIDHLDEETIRHIHDPQTLFAGPDSCYAHFLNMGIGENRLKRLNRGGSLEAGKVRLTGVHAEHTGDSIGVVLEYDGLKLYLTGDTLFHEKLKSNSVIDCDMVICCINGKLGNMDHSQAAELCISLNPRVAIPCHYGMFSENTVDPALFKNKLAGSTVAYKELVFNRPTPV